jgi:RNA-binding protein 25
LLDKEKYIIPPHLHDLQEADLPETQRGLVISEIAQFRERAAKREREKVREVKESIPGVVGMMAMGQTPSVPSGPKMREWGRQKGAPGHEGSGKGSYGSGAQGYQKPVSFVKAEDSAGSAAAFGDDRSNTLKTDEQLEEERKEARRRDEEASFRDVNLCLWCAAVTCTDSFRQRERRYEPRERARIQALERTIARERAIKEAEERDRVEIRSRLEVWDDDESDEMFYVDR